MFLGYITMEFYNAFRKLNLFLLVLCICPFSQNKKTWKFECKAKYVCYNCALLLTYFVIVWKFGYAKVLEICQKHDSLTDSLKSIRILGDLYKFVIILFLMNINYKPHKLFFNEIYELHCVLMEHLQNHTKFRMNNCRFWTECFVYTFYFLIGNVIDIVINDKKNVALDLLLRCCLITDSVICGIIIFYMKHCVANLFGFYGDLYELMQYAQSTTFRRKCGNFRRLQQEWEVIMKLYDQLIDIQKHLGAAFGSALLFTIIYDMFFITLSIYIVIEAIVRDSEDTSSITIRWFLYDAPLNSKDVYFIFHFHQMGEQV